MRFTLISCFLVIMLSCTPSRDYPDEKRLSPVPTTTQELFNADPETMDLVPASQLEIDKVKGAEDAYVIEYGYSFGECYGFCEQHLIMSSQGILLTAHRWEDDLTITTYHEILESRYADLIASIDFDAFQDFNEDLGCGDCTDAGSEYLEVTVGGETKLISGTFGYDCVPVAELLVYLRQF